MTRLSIAPKSGADAWLGGDLEVFRRRVVSTPPGTCPLAVQLSLAQTAASQTCGKCVPCRDGIPKLIHLLERICVGEADRSEFDEMRTLAEMIRDMSDCAIGYDAAQRVLEGIEIYADEYESHLDLRTCTAGIAQTVPCETLCPAHVKVAAYGALVAEGDYTGAIQVIRRDNPFPTACAYVCEHPCENRCRRALIDAPVNIRGIKKFAVDRVASDCVPVPQRLPDTGRSVAVVGGGPSGLTCAYFLALMGHRVTVFEARTQLGGMMRYGIPAYRLPREKLDEDIRAILSVGGIEVVFGEQVDADEMRRLAANYDAVYVAIGAQAGKTLRIDGIDAEGVTSAAALLEKIGDGVYPDFTGKRVVVVGGGNVAMDCARTSVRAQASEVTVVYRRRLEDMTALPSEVESAIAEGVEMLTLQAPVGIEVDGDGRCSALRMQPQMIGAMRGGRPVPMSADKPLEYLGADMVQIAVGQDVVYAPFVEFGMEVERGCFTADEFLHAPGFEHVLVGGDCQTGPSTVIRAIAAGKVAARNIDELMGYHHKLDQEPKAPDPMPNNRIPTGRVNASERPARERKADFEVVEREMSREEIVQECRRCLRCDVFGCGSQEGGRTPYV